MRSFLPDDVAQLALETHLTTEDVPQKQGIFRRTLLPPLLDGITGLIALNILSFVFAYIPLHSSDDSEYVAACEQAQSTLDADNPFLQNLAWCYGRKGASSLYLYMHDQSEK